MTREKNTRKRARTKGGSLGKEKGRQRRMAAVGETSTAVGGRMLVLLPWREYICVGGKGMGGERGAGKK